MFHFETPPQEEHISSFSGQTPVCFKSLSSGW